MVPEMDPDVLGIITQVADEEEVEDEFGRTNVERKEFSDVIVRFDGRDADLACCCGQVLEYVRCVLRGPVIFGRRELRLSYLCRP